MGVYKTITKTKAFTLWTVTGLTTAILLIFPTQCRTGAENGVFLCIQVLIPSLFPFMVLSSFIVKSGIASIVPSETEKLTRFLFGLPKESLCAIILSLTGGYPIGAKIAEALLKENKISKAQAERMSLFCVSSGPGFLVTFVGCSMLGDKKTGYLLLLSQILSFLILGVISKYLIKGNDENKTTQTTIADISAGEAIVSSVSDAIKDCAYMCALVILFGAVCEIFIELSKDIPQLIWITALFEITNGVKYLSQGYSPVLISALCGFSGLCVHFQIFSLLKGIRIPKFRFYLFRILQGILNGTFTYILLMIFPRSEDVFSTISKAQPHLNKGIAGCIILIISSVFFLLSIKDKGYYANKTK